MESLDIIKCIYDITADKRHCMVKYNIIEYCAEYIILWNMRVWVL